MLIIAKYVALCGICKKVKAKHQRPTGLLKPLVISMRKWENSIIDCVVGLPRSPRDKDAIWDVIDRITKVAHFILMKTTNSASNLVPLYIKEMVRLHGVPKSIVSDQDYKFISIFFGEVCIVFWALPWISALIFTHRWLVSRSVLYRP